jgi:uncharacterized double-CXXCG motif protein
MAARRLYLLQPDDRSRSPVINAAYRLGLPGLFCSTCGETWAAVGVHYPSSRIRSPRLRKQLATPRALPTEEWLPLQALLRREVGNIFLPPGTDFGPLVGHANALSGHFTWLTSWTLLACGPVAARLRTLGVSSVPHRIRVRRPSSPYRELVLPPLARLRKDRAIACGGCRRPATPSPTLLSAANIVLPPRVHLARIRQWPTVVVASEAFARLVKANHWSGVVFTPPAT